MMQQSTPYDKTNLALSSYIRFFIVVVSNDGANWVMNSMLEVNTILSHLSNLATEGTQFFSAVCGLQKNTILCMNKYCMD